MQTAIKGRLTMEAAASPGLFTNIIATTAQMVIKSGIRVVTQLDSTSFRELMSPITSPMYSSGIVTSTFMIGSRSTAPAFAIASLNAMDPAMWNAISEESTSW